MGPISRGQYEEFIEMIDLSSVNQLSYDLDKFSAGMLIIDSLWQCCMNKGLIVDQIISILGLNNNHEEEG